MHDLEADDETQAHACHDTDFHGARLGLMSPVGQMCEYSTMALLVAGMAIFLFGLVVGLWVRRPRAWVDKAVDVKQTLDGTESIQKLLADYDWHKDDPQGFVQ